MLRPGDRIQIVTSRPVNSSLDTGHRSASVPILIAEDEPVSRQILHELVRSWGYDAIVAEDGIQTLEALGGDDAPRLAILDWMMPGVDGVDICRRLRSKDGGPYTYVIVLTAMSEPDKMIEAMEAGADDFLGKPFQPHELEVRLRAGQRIVKLQEELIQAREELRELATTDVLTKIWNRRSILEILDKELARLDRAGSEGRGIGVLMADLDHFKAVNDSHGHLVGDKVLRESAQRIRRLLRRHDEVGRFGGEEFLILVGNCDAISLELAAERIRDGVGGRPIETDAGPVCVTISIGGALHHWSHSTNPNALLERADHALYEAKNGGRNRVVVTPGD